MRLPMFGIWTVDERLREFRGIVVEVEDDEEYECMQYISFDSEIGAAMYNDYRASLA